MPAKILSEILFARHSHKSKYYMIFKKLIFVLVILFVFFKSFHILGNEGGG